MLFARYEADSLSPHKPFQVGHSEAQVYNKKGYGIFQTVNVFADRRVIDCLVRVLSWYVEIDFKGPKDPLHLVINKLLLPSRVVETKSGYHVYFDAVNASNCKKEYRLIQKRLCEFYKSDPNATDLARFLRAPNFYHWKDPKNPYLCKLVFESDAKYKKETLLALLPPSKEELDQQVIPEKSKQLVTANSDDFIEWVRSMNQKTLLEQLSGSNLVGFDSFQFQSIGGNKFNSVTNGKASSWWIDELGMIGSSDEGGPTVFQFVAWYLLKRGMDRRSANKKAYFDLKEFFTRGG